MYLRNKYIKSVAVMAALLLLFQIFAPIKLFADSIVTEFNENDVASDEFTIPDSYFDECPHKGEIRYEHYDAFYKTHIYLPYGYTENMKCEILLLFHGSGGEPDDLLTNRFKVDDKYISLCNIYDWLHYEGKIKPVIIICMDGDSTSRNARKAISYVADTYKTYAKDGSNESLEAARNHIGIGGMSRGCNMALGCLNKTLDIAGNYFLFSGSSLIDFVDISAFQYKISCLIVGYGRDESYAFMNHSYCSTLEPFSEKSYEFVYDGGHEWSVWIKAMYKALLACYGHDYATAPQVAAETKYFL